MAKLIIQTSSRPDREADLFEGETTLGSDLGSDIVLMDKGIEPHHLTFELIDDVLNVRAANGVSLLIERAGKTTAVQGPELHQIDKTALARIADVTLRFSELAKVRSNGNTRWKLDWRLFGLRMSFVSITGLLAMLIPIEFSTQSLASARLPQLPEVAEVASTHASPTSWADSGLTLLSRTARDGVDHIVFVNAGDPIGSDLLATYLSGGETGIVLSEAELTSAIELVGRTQQIEVQNVRFDEESVLISANMSPDKERDFLDLIAKEIPVLPVPQFENHHREDLQRAVAKEIIGLWDGNDPYLMTDGGKRVKRGQMVNDEVQFLGIINAEAGLVRFSVYEEEVTWSTN